MPIKFRCSYCRQFLGISRNRVGGIVDCPTCGRSIRVPGLDGVAAPLPGPELDREDAHLARALDELAAFAEAPVHRPVMESIDDVSEEAEIPQPLPEPEPVELPMPIRMSPVTVIEPIGTTNTETAGSAGVLDELLQPLTVPSERERSSQVVEQTLPTRSLLFIVLLPLGSLLCGWGMGWWARGQTHSPITVAQAAPDPVEPVAVPLMTGLEGRITYRLKDGEVRPDVGALVIALPESWTGQLRLSPIGLRPGDSDADQTAALKMAAGFGGSAARTDDAGRYQLSLPPGRYTVFTISRFAEGAVDEAPSDEDLTQLRSFLSDPVATIGKRGIQIQSLTISADHMIAGDHAFE